MFSIIRRQDSLMLNLIVIIAAFGCIDWIIGWKDMNLGMLRKDKIYGNLEIYG